MLITYLSTTCFGAYGHLQVDELTKTHICSYIWHAFLYGGGGGAGLLDGGTRSRVNWVGRGMYMGVYYANLSIVQFRTMMLGIHVYVYIGCRMRAVLASYNAVPHNRYQPHPAEPKQYTICSNRSLIS
jgi:hypothetical protein